jgi:SAM-dependent methyltransferase
MGAHRTRTHARHHLIAEFDDPRLVAIYDTINAYGPGEQPDFYGHLAADIGARTIVDLGCGTGLLTREMAGRGYTMTGIDPSAEMLAVARRGQHADRVEWIHGDTAAVPARHADLALMSGHVAQFFVTDDAWADALTALHAALRPGGTLAFESRNPDNREWERWTRAGAWTSCPSPGCASAPGPSSRLRSQPPASRSSTSTAPGPAAPSPPSTPS